ncbi:MAG: polysulfide reductase NrfD [Anaerolineales bacterium]|nr:polysulfide reductase NrfD [Anaerolineales bacterium]
MINKHYWGWPVAGYLFLGGLGGGMAVVSTAADLFWGKGDIFALGNFIASVIIGIGSGLLVFELGKPFRFWRVFSTQKAVMTVGAWLLGLLIITSTVYFSFWLSFLPWSNWILIRQLLAGFNLLLGVGVITYTGVLLGSMKARPFWSSPALPILFAVSGLSTGLAAQSLLAGLWPYQATQTSFEQIYGFLHKLDTGLIVFELLIVMIYVLMMRAYAGKEAEMITAKLLTGAYALPFWGGLIVLGLLIPLALYFIGGSAATLLAPWCVLIGGVFLRFLIVYSDPRKMLPGETMYKERLPKGNEAFLESWK